MQHPEPPASVPPPHVIQSMLTMLGIAVAEDDPRLADIGRELEAQAHFSALIEAVLADANVPAEAVVHAVERFDPAWATESAS